MHSTPKAPPPVCSLFEQLPGCWGCKDINSNFVYVNQNFVDLVGVSSHHDLIGKTNFDIPAPLTACAEVFQQQDQTVMTSGKNIQVLNIHPYPDGEWHAHIFTKMPWYSESGELIGVIFHGQAINEFAALEVGQWICRAIGSSKKDLTIGKETKPHPPLSPRESEVLFLHMYGKKPQFIANALGVSVKTIENHFANLRLKLGVKTKTDLMDKALELGVGSAIPSSLLRHQLSVVLSS
ncbi:helix-turn-helix transcriptional regulator [Enterovibrio norvegicus]|uniref:helix-turn-helix transcriptional regulator n=1 Tax=Enterovibrio norvegicus TaxID=188144 RepID=UPI0024B271CA|nr:helix-turn-helix transcriptional regulator [Enterovibrio norvegicus]